MLPEIDHFSSLAFEEICRQYFWQEGLSGKLPFLPANIGSWWDASAEIDLVVIGVNDAIIVECKWSNQAVGTNILNDLERKAEIVQRGLGGRRIQFALCSRSGYTQTLIDSLTKRSDIVLFKLRQILSGG